MANQIVGNAPQLESGYTFEEWTEVLEAWFTLNDINAEEKKRALFLTGLGSKGYHTLRALLQPNKPSSKTYEECKDALTTHYSPKPTEIVQRYKFYTCTQQTNETIPQFLAKLRQLSDGCNFKELENMLRDRLVVGCLDINVQRKLLGTSQLTFEKAVNIAIAMEVAKRDVEQIRKIGNPQDDPTSVHKLQRKAPEPQTRTSARAYKPNDDCSTPKRCWRCGGSHEPVTCKFRDEQCYKCSKIGHTKSQCEKVKAYQQKYYQKKRQFSKKAHHLDDGESDSSVGEMDHLEDESINRLSNSDPYMTTVIVNGKEVQLEVDTGSPWTIVPKEVYTEISKDSKPNASNIKLKSYTGEKVDIYGEAVVDVQLEPQMKPEKLSLVVVQKGASLMGRDWLRKYPQLLSMLACPNAPEANPSPPSSMHNLQDAVQEVLYNHAKLFDNSTVGVLKEYQAKVYPQEDNCSAKFYKAAPVSYAARKQIDATLDDLLEDGIIKPVKTADFACPIIAVPKPDALSRLPLQEEETSWNHPELAELDEAPKARINLLTDLDKRPVEAQEVKSATKKDRVLTKVKNYTLEGWPATRNLPEEVKPFAIKKEELSVEDDVLLWGSRVIIPDNADMKERILEELHSTHPGIVKMKSLARSYVWWPGIDKQLEQQVRSCQSCQQSQHSPAAVPTTQGTINCVSNARHQSRPPRPR